MVGMTIASSLQQLASHSSNVNSMQIARCAAIGVLIALQLTTDSWCHYIPDRKSPATTRRAPPSRSDRIQICGNALTSFIIDACEGVVGSFSQAPSAKDSVQTKITEECCDQECTLDYLQNYCGKTPLFGGKSSRVGKAVSAKLVSAVSRKLSAGSGRSGERRGSEGGEEVRVRSKKGRKKRKRSFRRQCAYKSFGHYLLKLSRGGRARGESGKGQERRNRSWPSIEVGTVSPEMERFGGQPVVVVKGRKSSGA